MKVQEIKDLIRDWFATLSIEEITSNKRLTDLFSMIEIHLLSLEVRSQ